jgi:hypothetical protein
MSTRPNLPRSKRDRSKLDSVRHHLLLRWLDAKFVHRPRIYIFQSLMAGLALVGILIAEDAITNGAVVAAIASSVAIVFFVPHSVASNKPFRIVGGHVSGIVAALCTVGIMMLLPDTVASNQWVIHTLQGASLALVILFMMITNTEHAPAAGTAPGLATSVPGNSVIFIVPSAIIISIVRTVLYKRLHNLM